MMASLKERLLSDIKTAMKAGEREKVAVLRLINSSLKNREIQLRPKPLTDQEVIAVLQKLSRQRGDSIEQFQKAGRGDLVEKEKGELTLINQYLPKPMEEGELRKMVADCIKELGAGSMKDMGRVMGAVIAKTRGCADNRQVSQIVQSLLK